MSEALEDLRNIKQNPEEVREKYRKTLNKSILWCGNIHSEDVKITNPLPRSVVKHHSYGSYREIVHRRHLTLESLFHFAKSEDE